MNPEQEKLAEQKIKSLQKEFLVIGKTHIKAWHAWLILGLVAGAVGGILLVANRGGFEGILAGERAIRVKASATKLNSSETVSFGISVTPKVSNIELKLICDDDIYVVAKAIDCETVQHIQSDINSSVALLLFNSGSKNRKATFKFSAYDAKNKLLDRDTRVVTVLPAPFIKVISPNGGENWQQGTANTIRWEEGHAIKKVNISISNWIPPCSNDPCPLRPIMLFEIVKETQNDGSFAWQIPSSFATGSYIVRITDSANFSVFDDSDAPFEIKVRGANN